MTDVRTNLEDLMKATVADSSHWSYQAIRPMVVPPVWHRGQYVKGDCSKGVQYLCKWAGGPDPMKENFGPYGNSQTLWLNLQHLNNPGQLQVGDIVTFGRSGEEHAAMVMQAGSDPLLWSFGHQGAPNTYRLSYDHRPAQYLRYPVPTYVPTQEDVLRHKQGWFAWMAWSLGEGDWIRYGKRNRKVRPNVPSVIPVDWWVRRAKFLLNRKKANESTTAK